ncbi:LeoA/HP0731 family dynamin-like GTPase [Actinobacillus minor]|uniref:LeoA/HP0731 family dynamin-like GTPase n=1 Tax=Actinobacillus minor TaxID=51047 RepID=UPI0023F26A4B|nr:LeoA/HP0731 family dynamin-like GTPase [Actinobacillus minor]MDD6911175.1 50S ribosome-binding GTPase [Actinobacillus minor]MDY4712488.1 LeoA/HP0731 family dynamin-like GTPase [Actinobacillus minor]
MTEIVKAFQEQQQKVLTLLVKLQDFINQGNEFGLTLPDELQTKLQSAIQNTQANKLKIALVGGFSEGKTSIAAAWLGKLDRSTMKISAAESSNEVAVYDIGDDCQLIDTPGLYGFKEQENSTNEIEKYKEITKKFVSEAHIVLYVMNSKNPIKESHKEDLVWLFRDLNLLSRTVFVLSRFDEVADVEDEFDYRSQLKIKQENVKGRLKEFLDLSPTEENALMIVGVSANPFDEGVEYWLENPEEFKQLSHIDMLQQATRDIVQTNGGLQEVANEARKSILSDIILNEMPLVEQQNKELRRVVYELDTLWKDKDHELKLISNEINEAREGIEVAINRYFGGLIEQVSGSSLETIEELLVQEIGEEGCIISSNINRIFREQTQSATISLNQQVVTFNADFEVAESALGKTAKQGIQHVIKNFKIDAKGVKAAKETIVQVGKMVGVDLKNVLKFKPYGAIKLAEKINKGLPLLGLAIEGLDAVQKIQVQEKFEKTRKQLKEDLGKQQKEILDLVSSKDFIPMFFQSYLELEEAFNTLQAEKEQQEERSKRFLEWKAQGEIIEAEFRVLS